MMIKCPECNKDVSDTAKTCPSCGYKLLSIKMNKKSICKWTTITLLLSFAVWYNYNWDVFLPKKERFIVNCSKGKELCQCLAEGLSSRLTNKELSTLIKSSGNASGLMETFLGNQKISSSWLEVSLNCKKLINSVNNAKEPLLLKNKIFNANIAGIDMRVNQKYVDDNMAEINKLLYHGESLEGLLGFISKNVENDYIKIQFDKMDTNTRKHLLNLDKFPKTNIHLLSYFNNNFSLLYVFYKKMLGYSSQDARDYAYMQAFISLMPIFDDSKVSENIASYMNFYGKYFNCLAKGCFLSDTDNAFFISPIHKEKLRNAFKKMINSSDKSKR